MPYSYEEHICKCESCPFLEAETEAAALMGASGCLPSVFSIVRLQKERGLNWACHSEPTRICRGLVREAARVGLDIKGKPLFHMVGVHCSLSSVKPVGECKHNRANIIHFHDLDEEARSFFND